MSVRCQVVSILLTTLRQVPYPTVVELLPKTRPRFHFGDGVPHFLAWSSAACNKESHLGKTGAVTQQTADGENPSMQPNWLHRFDRNMNLESTQALTLVISNTNTHFCSTEVILQIPRTCVYLNYGILIPCVFGISLKINITSGDTIILINPTVAPMPILQI